METNAVFNQIVILFLILVVGVYAKKKGIINDSVNKKLSELLLRITSPFLVISSFQFKFSKEMLYNVSIVLIFSIVAHALSILAGQLLYRKYPDGTEKVMKFASIYSNCGFMGFPILESMFGKAGVLYGSVYVAAFNLFLWTNGVMIFSGKKDLKTLKKAAMNPGILCVVIGMLIFLFSIHLPYPVSKTLDMIGSMTAPLSMLIVGSTLADVDFRKLLHGFPLYYVTSVRLIFIPLITLMILKLAGFYGVLLGTCVLLVAMPAAATTTIFAEMFGGDSLFSSRVVAFSTLLSIITIPVIILLL